MDQEPTTQSHPSVRFETLPIVEGPLHRFNSIRESVLQEVIARTKDDFDLQKSGQNSGGRSLEGLLGEALYLEQLRLKRDRGNFFTKKRLEADRGLWAGVKQGLLKPAAELDRGPLFSQVLHHYAEEIGGHFEPKTYWAATRMVPYLFNWLLNAASVRHFKPWGMPENLATRMQILGEIPLIQKLSKKGTVLLVPTHQSNIDSVLIGYIIYLMSLPPFAYGAGLNLFSNPVLSFFMSGLGAYTVDRKKNNEVYKHVLKNYSTTILEQGVHSIFFPGGGRSRSGAIESKLKLGLLGTALDAQLKHFLKGEKQARVYVFPLVMSYHFVLEASSLIEDFLLESGKQQFIFRRDESWQPTKVARFFWKLFSSNSGVTARLGRPLDVFGNPVDDEGVSLGPNGTIIDPERWFTTCGEMRADPQRDQIYTRQLGERIIDRYYRENTVLTSHAVAFLFFESLRKKYPDLDLYRFLRLTASQRRLAWDEWMNAVSVFHRVLRAKADRGEFYLAPEFYTEDVESWILHGAKNLGVLHDAQVVGVSDRTVFTDDMNLLYYYRNRLSGYGLSLLSQTGRGLERGDERHDKKGFLA